MRLIADLISRTRDELHGLASRLLGRIGGAIHAITAQAYASGFVGPRATLGALRTAARLNGTAIHVLRRGIAQRRTYRRS